ncbi:MAG: CoA-binding protein [Candidatus Hodarchaeota archaeon]
MDIKDISFINDIKTMAVIGTSEKRGFFFLKNHQENFKGKLYAVNPLIKEIPEFDKNSIYPSLRDIPGEVDFVFIAVPPSKTLEVMDECVEKGVKLASVFTAEFSDSGTKEGLELEKKLLRRAKNKVRLLGPNGLGLYYPKLGIAWRPRFSAESGDISFIAQSGGLCNLVIYGGNQLGMHFSKVFSFGNGADLDFVDLLYFLSNDPETKIIICYIEGIKAERANELKKILKQNKKPIAIVRGGQTKTGSIAAKTHTATISGENHIWKAIFTQYNVIELDSIEQLISFAYLIELYGLFDLKNLAVISSSGGYGVILVDLIEKAGMIVPPFSPDIQNQITSLFYTLGTSSKNPLDVSAQVFNSETFYNIINLALTDRNIDGMIVDLPSFYFNSDLSFRTRLNQSYENEMIEALTLGHKHRKPLIPILKRINCPEDWERLFKKLSERKVPVFGDPLEFLPLLVKISKYTRKIKN